MKLHLGCGQVYLDGYLNIDYPDSEHSVLKGIKVDRYADLLTLSYRQNSINEVRLHHVFEHFPRAEAIALLASWRSWLEPEGTIRIEVPDFDKMARRVLSPVVSKRAKSVALRHIFGSNEARWAVHYEGWSARRLSEVFELFGFNIQKITRNSWKGTHNIEVIGVKNSEKITINSCSITAEKYLSNYLVDPHTEVKLLGIWMEIFNNRLKATWGKK